MNDPAPIISITGDGDLHLRARLYNDRLTELRDLRDDLAQARNWNSYGRISHGFWGDDAKPPVPVSGITARIVALRAELARERDEILKLAKDWR